MKIVFMGTPAFSVPVLEALVTAHQVVAVYCQPPRPAGRGKRDRPSPVQARAEVLGLPVFHPVSLRKPEIQAEFAAHGADVAVVVAYGLILPAAILAAPRMGCLNIHASLLPRWRGAAPIHRAVMAGDTETGVCIMAMDEGLDTGPVLMRRACAIGPEDTTGGLQDRLAVIGADLMLAALAGLPGLVAEPQPKVGASYAAKIDKAEARVDWTRPAIAVDRLIRGLSPFPGAWCDVAGERVKLLRSRLAPGGGRPGAVLGGGLGGGLGAVLGGGLGGGPDGSGGMVLACGDGAVEVLEAQREGKRAMPAVALLRGWALPGFFG